MCRTILRSATSLIASVMLATMPVAAADAPRDAAKTAIVFDHLLPNVPGKSLKSVLVEYAPGGSSPAHAHADSAFIYAVVLEGEIRSQVNDGPAKIYRQGESFFEMPGDRHLLSQNASMTQPAILLAVFVVNTDDKVLTRPLSK